MDPRAAQNYLRTKVLTATPEQLQLMLFDGAIRFGEQARVALEQKNYEQSFKLITRLEKIINELSCSLRRDVSPELCGNLAALYAYAYRKAVDANLWRRIESLDEALRVLRYQRQTWAMLMSNLAQDKAAAAARKIDIPDPDQRMEASISAQA